MGGRHHTELRSDFQERERGVNERANGGGVGKESYAVNFLR